MYRNSKGWIISVTGIVARDSSCIDMDTESRKMENHPSLLSETLEESRERKRGVIGRYRDGRYDIPWRCRRDMAHFRHVTRHPTGEERWICIMGKNTYLSLEKRLVDRREIVISTSMVDDGVEVYRSIEECFDRLIDEGILRHIYVIGGNQLLQSSMQYIDDLYLTTIDTRVEGDPGELVYLDIELPWNMKVLQRDAYPSFLSESMRVDEGKKDEYPSLLNEDSVKDPNDRAERDSVRKRKDDVGCVIEHYIRFTM